MKKTISYKRYIEAFATIEKYSEEYDSQLINLQDILENNIKPNFNMLDIGAGSGNFVNEVFLKSKNLPSVYMAYEPSDKHVALLKKNLKGYSFKKRIIKEHYTPNIKHDMSFDLILLSHSIYWLNPNTDLFLINALKYLNKHGQMVIYIQTPILCSMMNYFFEKDLSFTKLLNHKLHCWDITDILEKNKINYKISYLPGSFRVTDIINSKDKLSDNTELMNILTHLLLVEVSSLNKKLRKKIVDLFYLHCHKQDNEVKFNQPVAAIQIFKT